MGELPVSSVVVANFVLCLQETFSLWLDGYETLGIQDKSLRRVSRVPAPEASSRFDLGRSLWGRSPYFTPSTVDAVSCGDNAIDDHREMAKQLKSRFSETEERKRPPTFASMRLKMSALKGMLVELIKMSS